MCSPGAGRLRGGVAIAGRGGCGGTMTCSAAGEAGKPSDGAAFAAASIGTSRTARRGRDRRSTGDSRAMAGFSGVVVGVRLAGVTAALNAGPGGKGDRALEAGRVADAVGEDGGRAGAGEAVALFAADRRGVCTRTGSSCVVTGARRDGSRATVCSAERCLPAAAGRAVSRGEGEALRRETRSGATDVWRAEDPEGRGTTGCANAPIGTDGARPGRAGFGGVSIPTRSGVAGPGRNNRRDGANTGTAAGDRPGTRAAICCR
jgi:hypothetical protein